MSGVINCVAPNRFCHAVEDFRTQRCSFHGNMKHPSKIHKNESNEKRNEQTHVGRNTKLSILEASIVSLRLLLVPLPRFLLSGFLPLLCQLALKQAFSLHRLHFLGFFLLAIFSPFIFFTHLVTPRAQHASRTPLRSLRPGGLESWKWGGGLGGLGGFGFGHGLHELHSLLRSLRLASNITSTS